MAATMTTTQRPQQCLCRQSFSEGTYQCSRPYYHAGAHCYDAAVTSQTTSNGPRHHASCPCVHCYGTQTYDIRSRCMGCEQKIPHGDVQLTAIGVMHHSCAYQLGWVATLEGPYVQAAQVA